MENNNITKNKLLGMSHGTAVHQLRKMIMFQMIQELGKDTCYRCGEKIENIDDLSIEHKIAWQSAKNPKETFFDLGNIAFSHLHCNIGIGRRMERSPIIHGTLTGYQYCRCDKCKKANADWQRNWRKKHKNIER